MHAIAYSSFPVLEFRLRIHWNEARRRLVLSIPTAFRKGRLLGEVPGGAIERPGDGDVHVHGRWLLVRASGGSRDAISSGHFSQGDTDLFRPLVDSLLERDEYLLLVDFAAYMDCSERAAAAFQDRDGWTRMSILNAARSGFFSSDRTIRQYSEEIWRVQPVAVR